MAGRCRRSRRRHSSARERQRSSSFRWVCTRPCLLLRRHPMLACIFGEDLWAFRQHILLYPCKERVALARDRIPFLVEVVVARIIALRIGGKGTTGHLDHASNGPSSHHDGVPPP